MVEVGEGVEEACHHGLKGVETREEMRERAREEKGEEVEYQRVFGLEEDYG